MAQLHFAGAAEVARRRHLALLVGLPELDADSRVINTAVLLDEAGADRQPRPH